MGSETYLMDNNGAGNIDSDDEDVGPVRDDMVETAAARSDVYGLLATVFRAEPTQALIRQLRDPGLAEFFAGLGVSFGDDLLNTPDDQLDRLEEDLAVEFCVLFIGPGDFFSPHESVHVEDITGEPKKTLWGEETVQVKKFIEAAGLNYENSFSGNPDHISAELEFMEMLTRREAEVWNSGECELALDCLKIQKKFFEQHLDNWVPAFCQKIAEKTEHSFFRGMAQVTKGFLDFERENLDGYLSVAAEKS
jgi:TorA maturation chaperone TorD